MTSKKPNPEPEVKSGWDKAARALAARLGLKDHTVWGLTSRIASSAWARRYYAEQPNMIQPTDLDPDLDTVLDALRLIPAARYAVDVDERDLIRAARDKGASWEAIGVALGAKQSGARQTARGRYERLGGYVTTAVPGKAAEAAPALVDPGERVPVAPEPVNDWPLPGERGEVPAAAFVEPTLLDPEPKPVGDEGPVLTWADITEGCIIRYKHHSRERRLRGREMLTRRARVQRIVQDINYGQGQITVVPLNKDDTPNASLGSVILTLDRVLEVVAPAGAT